MAEQPPETGETCDKCMNLQIRILNRKVVLSIGSYFYKLILDLNEIIC